MSIGLIAFGLSCIGALGTCVGGYWVTHSSKWMSVARLSTLSAGVMIYMSIFDLLPEAQQHLSAFASSCFFFIGMALMAALEYLIPDSWFPDFTGSSHEHVRNLHSTWMTWLAMMCHNWLEGVAVYMSTLQNPAIGLALAFSIACHNLAEGMTVAIPIYSATSNLRLTMKYTLLNAICEPLSVLLCCFVFGFNENEGISQMTLSCILAGVAGIMSFISLYELYPASFQPEYGQLTLNWDTRKRRAMADLAAGMAVGCVILGLADLLR